MRTHAAMARLLADSLLDAELLELGAMLDGDSENQLLHEIEAINAQRHPDEYVPHDAAEKV